jgi:hypothetical protein
MKLLEERWGARILLNTASGEVILADPFAGMRSEWEMDQLELIRQSYEG